MGIINLYSRIQHASASLKSQLKQVLGGTVRGRGGTSPDGPVESQKKNRLNQYLLLPALLNRLLQLSLLSSNV